MGKKRNLQPMAAGRLKIEVKDEIGDNDVLVARDRLKGALRELLQHSDSGSSAESSEESSPQEYKHQIKKLGKFLASESQKLLRQLPIQIRHHLSAAPSGRMLGIHPMHTGEGESMMPSKAMRFQQAKKIRRRRQVPTDTAFHHTYVMKLFDRSVDLAQFREDTPLYPICRAWMANQPRNPNLVPKIRSPSPEILNEVNSNSNLFDSEGDVHDVYSLPAPSQREEAWPRNRVPSPITLPKEELNLDYEGQTLRTREALMKDHVSHWTSVRKKWHQQAHKNEQRFEQSANVLGTMFRRAQTEFE